MHCKILKRNFEKLSRVMEIVPHGPGGIADSQHKRLNKKVLPSHEHCKTRPLTHF